MLPAHVFTLANRTMKKPLLAAASVAFSLAALLGSVPAFADPATDTLIYNTRDTSNPDDWKVKYLGYGIDLSNVMEDGRYTNGILDTAGYEQVKAVAPRDGWVTEIPWISPREDMYVPSGLYSYVTIINDSSFIGTEFMGVLGSFSAANTVYFVVINGIDVGHFWGLTTSSRYFDHNFTNIPWNAGGDNTIEVIVNSAGLGGYGANALSAAFQLRYAAPVPEPTEYAMLLAGLGIIGVAARRRKMKVN